MLLLLLLLLNVLELLLLHPGHRRVVFDRAERRSREQVRAAVSRLLLLLRLMRRRWMKLDV